MSNPKRILQRRAVFKLPDLGGGHHYTLASRTNHACERCVFVNWTTRRKLPPGKPGQDTSCVLNRSDHPAITVESVVHYNGARLVKLSLLRNLIEVSKISISDVLLTEDALNRLMLGFKRSPHASEEVREFLEQEGLMPPDVRR